MLKRYIELLNDFNTKSSVENLKEILDIMADKIEELESKNRDFRNRIEYLERNSLTG